MNSNFVVTKDFLEKALGKRISSFTMKAHADTGNNFLSILYTFEVNVRKNGPQSQIDTLYIISKCYPSNPGRQEFLIEHNIFYREFAFYKQWIPEVLKFQKELGTNAIVVPNCAQVMAGEVVDFFKKDQNCNKSPKKVFHPFDNYIMMVDLCKTKGFHTVDPQVGLNIDQALLAMEAYAKLHALSWAYQNHKKIDSLKKEFTVFNFYYAHGETKQLKTLFDCLMSSTIDEATLALASCSSLSLEVPVSDLISALTAYRDIVTHVIEMGYDSGHGDETEADLSKYFRVKPAETLEIESSWRAIIHGDSHINNLLFRYNMETGKSEEVAFVDFQMSREMCPIVDLVYCIHTSTDTQFRKDHLDKMLELYHEKFIYYCKLLKTETFPGFTLEEIKRRFHRLRIFGLAVGLFACSLFLREKDKAVQLDSLLGMTTSEIFALLPKGISESSLFVERATKLVEEMYIHGVI